MVMKLDTSNIKTLQLQFSQKSRVEEDISTLKFILKKLDPSNVFKTIL